VARSQWPGVSRHWSVVIDHLSLPPAASLRFLCFLLFQPAGIPRLSCLWCLSWLPSRRSVRSRVSPRPEPCRTTLLPLLPSVPTRRHTAPSVSFRGSPPAESALIRAFSGPAICGLGTRGHEPVARSGQTSLRFLLFKSFCRRPLRLPAISRSRPFSWPGFSRRLQCAYGGGPGSVAKCRDSGASAALADRLLAAAVSEPLINRY
jgi:hypothetical protein